MKHSQNKPRRREPYHYDASGAQYIACIETALQHGQSIPVHVLRVRTYGSKQQHKKRPICAL